MCHISILRVHWALPRLQFMTNCWKHQQGQVSLWFDVFSVDHGNHCGHNAMQTCGCLPTTLRTLKIKVIRSSEEFLTAYKSTWLHNPDTWLHNPDHHNTIFTAVKKLKFLYVQHFNASRHSRLRSLYFFCNIFFCVVRFGMSVGLSKFLTMEYFRYSHSQLLQLHISMPFRLRGF
jgi:hypothetical protein